MPEAAVKKTLNEYFLVSRYMILDDDMSAIDKFILTFIASCDCDAKLSDIITFLSNDATEQQIRSAIKLGVKRKYIYMTEVQ